MRFSRIGRTALCLASACWLVAVSFGDDAAGPGAGQEAARANAQETLDALRKRAQELSAKQDFAGALELLRQAEKRFGASAEIHLDQGWTYFRRAAHEAAGGAADGAGDPTLVRALFADAMVRAKKALSLDADCAGAALLLAQSTKEYGDEDGARAACRAWLQVHPGDLMIRGLLAQWHFAAKEWEGADLHYTKLLEANPSDGPAWLNRTIARQWLRIPAAELEPGYLQAARLLPEVDQPLRLLAGLYPKDRDRKLAALEKVVAENPKAVWARVWIAHVLRKEAPRDPVKAFATLREAEKLAPDNAGVHFQIAQMLEESGGLVEAVQEYTLAVDKGAPGAMAQASAALDRLLNQEPGNEEVPLADRLRAYDVLCAKNPKEGSYGNNAGLWFRDTGRDYEKSLKYYLLSVKAAPDDQDFLNDTGLIYLYHLADRKDEGLPYFERVVQLVEKEGQEPIRGYWDALENLCKHWLDKGAFEKVVAYADKRASEKATMNGRPYPSARTAQYRTTALAELEKSKK